MFMLNHPLYNYTCKKIAYSSIFKETKFVPENLPITAVLSVPILNNKAFLVKQQESGWWDIPGGHIEDSENWEDSINRELREEVGIIVDNHQIIGYFEITSTASDLGTKSKYPSPSAILVTLSFVQKYIPNWEKPKDILDRAIVQFKRLDKYVGNREGSNQLMNVLLLAKKELDALSIIYEFSFVKDNIDFNIPVTQVYGFCKDASSDEFCIVRETGQNHYSLPGGGCEIGESPEEAFRRELMEEALLKTDDIALIGATRVDIYTPDKKTHLQTILQVRFYTDIKEIVPFIPNKDGFEIEERIFVSLPNLIEKVDWLKTEVGSKIIAEINKLK